MNFFFGVGFCYLLSFHIANSLSLYSIFSFLSFFLFSLSLSLSLPPFPSQPYGVFLAFQHWSHGWVRQGGITNFSQPVSSTTLIENKKLYFQAMKILFIHSL